MQPTAEQLPVIEHAAGNALVTAVAGSGKSATLVERIARMLEGGADARRMLVVMFNRSAADDFRRRLCARLRAPMATLPDILTFHALGQRLCAEFVRRGWLRRARLVVEDAHAHHFAGQVLSRMQTLDSAEPDQRATLLEAAELLKGIEYAGGPLPEHYGVSAQMVAAFARFEALRREQGLRFFGDLIAEPVEVALREPAAADYLAGRYGDILVDEFQDINASQMSLLRLLCAGGARVIAVGDDDQCIYAWRGAQPRFMIEDFEREFAPVQHYRLTHTFRYGAQLADLANRLIAHNQHRLPKTSRPALERSTQVQIRLYDHDPAAVVVEEVEDWIASGRLLSEAAILVREFSQTAPIEIDLFRSGIPAHVVGASCFADTLDGLALRGWLHLAEEGFASIQNPEGLGAMVDAMVGLPNLWLPRAVVAEVARDVVQRPQRAHQILGDACLDACRPGADGRNAMLRDFAALLRSVAARPSSGGAAALLEDVIARAGLLSEIQNAAGSPMRARDRIAAVRGLLAASRHRGLSVHGLRDALADASRASNAWEGVLITSLHRAKGLEWPLVILPGMEAGVFPSDGTPLEDERRLCYVGMTRAIDRLVLCTYADPALASMVCAEAPRMPPARVSRFVTEALTQGV